MGWDGKNGMGLVQHGTAGTLWSHPDAPGKETAMQNRPCNAKPQCKTVRCLTLQCKTVQCTTVRAEKFAVPKAFPRSSPVPPSPKAKGQGRMPAAPSAGDGIMVCAGSC